ncbi:chemosensory pili system protein ChpA (sensor histidine kinase/response regulator) [Duganella sp. CF402]|uniref:hybrid sensor histidine kinase/response regulator n=1 Tax=unclassified Duganella TaxID=2636909 RepID=UPI0008D4D696|nr:MULTISPECIES: Hpt domain-containing protein [unclassified Duganella]RZT08561.1 chemosensory pili system protein ChpA (sensor histidine kinase/response regulator) [Duganella sp. BK701]SEL89643.1 chemosensory pili system protein ChpA (sensor histidine kinase/response regulator) [Duganella sp. CF402]
MTTNDFSTPQQPQLDTGPLSWVMVEIRESLARSRTALFEAGGRAPEDQATQLQHAKSHLHQAHGALQMVDVDGVSLMTEVAEAVLDRFKAGTLKCSTDHAQTVAQLYQALVEYLEELLEGAPSQPARLFPYYRAMQEMMGVERIHPADLFYPDLSQPVSLPLAEAVAEVAADPAPDYAAFRQRFERALLPYLKGAGDAGALLDAIKLVADAQQDGQARAFWLAMQAFAELVAGGELPGGLYVKQLFGLINLQIRRLSQGQAAQPEAMLRDALFFVATAGAQSASPTVQQVRAAYALEGLAPADCEIRRYGQVDTEALDRAKAGIVQAKAQWDRLANAEIDPDLDAAFDAALQAAAGECDKLNLSALGALLRQLADVARKAVSAGRSEELALEMATALLFAEHGLQHIRHLPDDFAAHADTIGARLLALVSGETPPEPAQWQKGLARQMQQDDTVVALAMEMKTGLRQVEKVLDDYYADPSKRPALLELDPVLYQLQGALAVLDQNDAMQAARHVKSSVQALAHGDGDPSHEPKALDDIAQNVGALGFFVDMLAQNAAGARERFAFDAEHGTFRSVPFKKIPASESIPVLEEQVPAPAPVAMPVEAPPPASSDAAVEEELLEIFISEAQEVLMFVGQTLPLARTEENLTMLRRSFHTLKGSGRMVGLNQFADAAYAIEKVMNVWLAEQRAATDALFELLNGAEQEMSAWVAELVASGVSARNADALTAAAARVMDGGEPDLAPSTAALPADDAQTPAEEAIAPPAAAPALPPLVSHGNVIEFPTITPTVPRDDNVKLIGGMEIPLPLYNIYLHESDDLVRKLEIDFSEWRHEPRRPVNPEALAASHTLAGTSGTVGFKALRELALALEGTLELLLPPAPHLDQAQHDLLDFTMQRIRQMLQGFAAGELSPAQPELIAALNGLRDELMTTPPAASNDIESRLDSLVAETMDELHAPVAAQESPLDQLFRETFNAISGTVPESEAPTAPPSKKKPEVHVDDGIDDLFNAAFDDAFADPPLEIAEPLAPAPAPDAAPVEPEPVDEPEAEVIALATAEPEILAAAPAIFNDELDADLLPVFLEEGADLLPQVGEALRAWQHTPTDTTHAQSLLRLLHTVKGSARMAGAMRLGQHCHEIETHIENMVHAGSATSHAFDELLAHYDHALLLFEQLQHPESLHADAIADADAEADAEAATDAIPAATPSAALPTGDDAQPGVKAPLVRVRADILDRLVTQAGEVSISRSRLENEVDTLRNSLADFSDNLARLRRQLREVEMQAESQIASRMAVSSEREFDPLEFDRFTRLQELTRMMAESVNDVASFHESLTRSVDTAHSDLTQQARLTRDLQRDLMRVRMVPFASISERLFRVARQSAKDVDKRVNLDIRGSNVELDRSVLERMAAPFEHLLRNAIAHGVEAREVRAAAGKSETGELLVQVAQEGNEVVIAFSDDGGGLDLARIKAKAISVGLLDEHEQVTDAQIADLIFEPGFSTAEALTELSGRGVGMDVVQSEAQSLGGRIDLYSEPGKGSRFTIRLPLTLAVTQVVVLAAGGRTYALPAILVEQVLQMKEHALAEARHNGMQYLPTLLGDPVQPPVQRSSPVMMLKNGNDKLALQVDEVLGNREVVIKNIGPQLSRMVGIAGATVLGTGDIVLILNPVALAQHLAHHPEVKQLYAQAAADSPAAPAQQGRTIMVVDDSLTVRRVTQRLLEREGYRVLLAKDGVDALEQLQETRPELMLVDIEMPRMDGFDLTRNVRGDERTREIPIIMITSRSADKHRNVALELGVNAYFGKPFQEDVLLEAIAGLIKPAS